jgi:hypothetical protein
MRLSDRSLWVADFHRVFLFESQKSQQTDRDEGQTNVSQATSANSTLLLTGDECDERLMRLQDGVELALHRAKLWSKYAKDITTYIEKRVHFGKRSRFRSKVFMSLSLSLSLSLMVVQLWNMLVI